MPLAEPEPYETEFLKIFLNFLPYHSIILRTTRCLIQYIGVKACMSVFKIILSGAILLSVFCQNQAYSDNSVNYSFIKPGLTLKREVDAFLGEPTKMIVPDARYRYSSDHYAVKYIEIVYVRDSSRVDFFVLFMQDGIYSEDAKLFFNLEQPTRKRYNHDGGLVELYFPQGIFLHYLGTGNNSRVEKVEIVSSLFYELLADHKYNEYIDNYIYGLGVTVEDIASQGLEVLSIKDASPAHQYGLQLGDIILEIEDFVFNAPQNLERFKKTIKHLPFNQKLRFRVERERFELDIDVALAELTDSEKMINSFHEMRESQKDLASQLLPVKRSLYVIDDLIKAMDTIQGDLPPGIRLDDDGFLMELEDSYDSDNIITESIPGLYFMKDENDLKGVPFLDFSTIRYFDNKLLLKLSLAFIKVEEFAYAVEILSKLLEYDKRNINTLYLLAYSYDKLEEFDSALFYYNNVKEIAGVSATIKEFAQQRCELLKQ